MGLWGDIARGVGTVSNGVGQAFDWLGWKEGGHPYPPMLAGESLGHQVMKPYMMKYTGPYYQDNNNGISCYKEGGMAKGLAVAPKKPYKKGGICRAN